MYVIGVTGIMGSGKTVVAQMLREKGAALIQADPLAYEVYAKGTPAWQEIVAAFGKALLSEDGTIDRQKLGALVFSDHKARERLNTITHPRMKELIRQRLTSLTMAGTKVAVLEAALLLEAGWDDLIDEVWVTVAPPEVAAQRVTERTYLTQEEALARIRTQLSNQEALGRAAVVIDTNCSLEETQKQVDGQWARLLDRLGLPAVSQRVR